MKKITDFIVDKRYLVIGVFLVVTILSFFMMDKVNINYDMSKYLPDDSETKIGMNIMDEEFEEINTSSLNLMFKDLSSKEKESILKELENIKNVSSVEYDSSSEYNKEDYTLYVINVDAKDDSKIAKGVYNDILKTYQEDYVIETSGSIASRNKSVLPGWIVALAIICALIILLVMCNSYIEPFLFLFSIGIAVFINKGTNIFFSSVSNITDSIVAILQMALSMDYSIMLMNRYDQEKDHEKNKIKAMKEALYKSFGSISSSSITTIVGLLALVFMSFTIGKDLGVILAKGVLLSLLSIFCVLPGLILIFDKVIEKTKKKSLNINLNKLGNISYKLRYIVLILFIGIFIASYILKGNLNIVYTENETDAIEEIFKENNQMAIIYNNEYENEIKKYCKELENNEKINSILCYGNTINEELTYEELNDKLASFGVTMEIDNNLLKVLYYHYYNQNSSEKLTFEEFVSFINKQTINNDIINSDTNMKENISKLTYFISEDEINKKRNSKELANILQIDEESIQQILLLYNANTINTKMSLKDFIDFVNNIIITNNRYKNSFSDNDLKNLNRLEPFTNKNTINTKLDYEQMASLFGLDKENTKNLYNYYISLENLNTKLTINEFATFILNNNQISSFIDTATYEKIKLLNKMSNNEFITTEMDSNSISELFNLNNAEVKKVMLVKYLNKNSNTRLTLKDFIINTTIIKNNTTLLDGVDVSSIENLYHFAINENDFNTTNLNKNELSNIFGNQIVEMVYNYFDSSYEMSPLSFVNYVLNNFSSYLDEENLNVFQLIKMVIEDTNIYTSSQLSLILNVDSNKINQLFVIIDYANDNTASWTISPSDFVAISFANNPTEELALLNSIIENKDVTYTYSDLAQIIGIDENSIRQIYLLYTISNQNLTLTPKEFVEFLLNHQNDPMLKESISNVIDELLLIQKIMDDTLNNKKYTVNQMENLLGIDRENLRLLYSLYYIQTNDVKVSLYDITNFMINNVMTNKNYANQFTENSKEKLNTINGIMKASLNHIKYTPSEIQGIISQLSPNVNQNMIDLIYIYYGSQNYYKNSWTMSIETLISYLNNNIVKDERFNDFIDEKMKENISNAKKIVFDAKKMLVGTNYSRIVINTKLDYESKETFDFIQNIKNDLNKVSKDFYLIGDSPMAYDMSKSFQSELNFITILTMIAIFVVVAITFKSFIIPLILVLIIQCAVYLTMGILSVMGGQVYFIAILIVQSILMGATIDYAILYTSYYKESRNTMSVVESLKNSYNKSIHTILTSSSILIIVTLIVGCFASAVAAKICKTLSQGTLCAALLILFILPSILALCDKWIIKKKNTRNSN